MSRGFRICMANGGRGCLRPTYGWPKLTLVSRFAVSIFKNTLPILHTWQMAVSNEYMFTLSGKFSLDM